MKKLIKKEIKIKKSTAVWDKELDKSVADLKEKSIKNDNCTIFICTTTPEVKGKSVTTAWIHSKNTDITTSIAAFLESINEKNPSAVQMGIMKFISNR